MALAKIIDKLEDVPEAFREHYGLIDSENPDKGFELGLKGDTGKQRLGEFRTRNIALQKDNAGLTTERDALQQQLTTFEGIDPVKHRKAMEALSKIESSEEAQMIADGKLDEVLEKRTIQMRERYESDLSAKSSAYDDLVATNAKLTRDHSKLLIGGEVEKAIAASGVKVRGTAMQDILARTHEVFSMKDGRLVATNGDSPVHGPTGDPLTMKDHINTLASTSAHLFEGGGGGGANGSGGNGPTNKAGGKMVIDPKDHNAVGKHLDKLASGEAVFSKAGD